MPKKKHKLVLINTRVDKTTTLVRRGIALALHVPSAWPGLVTAVYERSGFGFSGGKNKKILFPRRFVSETARN